MELFSVLLQHHPFLQAFLWVVAHSVELIATITGLQYIIYSVKEDKLLWIYGLVSSLISVFVFFGPGLYAETGINIYYVLVSIYGWLHWTFREKESKKELPISLTKPKEGLIIFVITLILYILIAYLLKYHSPSTVPYLDALTASASITATWMLARKMLEQWLIWIVVDAISVGLCIYKNLYAVSFLYFVYTILAFAGYIEWKKQWKQQVSAQS
jgi:nicotinamide mononucleotide transporter